jgi:hypothetical protein
MGFAALLSLPLGGREDAIRANVARQATSLPVSVRFSFLCWQLESAPVALSWWDFKLL